MTESPCLRTYVREKLDILINNDEISKNIEIGIFNVSIKQAENIGVIKKWDNIHFALYLWTSKVLILNKNLLSFRLSLELNLKVFLTILYQG